MLAVLKVLKNFQKIVDKFVEKCYYITCLEKKCGYYSKEDTPVPIPNTEVKLLSADGTWGATPWESRT